MDKLLERSVEYEELVFGMLTLRPYDNSKRIQLSHTMCAVSIEHSESLKILLESGNFTSSIGLLRLQFEALVRAIWIFYSASDSVVEKLSLDLNDSIPRTNERLPMLSEMLKNLEEKAPENALKPLLEFKEYSWKPLSSFVHGGIHAITRHSKGYPPAILEQALLASNGVNGMSGYFLAILTGNPATVKDFYQSYFEFSDCLPSIKP
jgi:hypothetical protein